MSYQSVDGNAPTSEETAHLYKICLTCGEKHVRDEFEPHAFQCKWCDKEQDDAFQKALNGMPADFVLTFNLVVATYYEGLAEKGSIGENIEKLIEFGKRAQEEKRKEFHS